MTWDGKERRAMNQDQIDRDRMLTEVHSDVTYIRKWADKHEKDDDIRFKWAFAAIIILAGVTGVIPQIMSAIK